MKKYFALVAITGLFAIQASCQSTTEKNKEVTLKAEENIMPVEVKMEDGFARAYFASGCFWCVEAVYESVKGVEESISGYSGGTTQNPSYRSHGDHAEAVEIFYDPEVVTFSTLLDVYFGSQNITQINGQGPDRGASYRAILFYQNEEQKGIIDAKIAMLNKKLDGDKVAAQVMPFQKFWLGEAYHQNYERNNPDNPYVQNVSVPRLLKFQKKFPELLKKTTNH
ncbi:MAG: peptide-methionine (S)-S-oxide reductase [Candidatus Latescibacterota bacterium]|jgi:peptide-methionine (S)-S-oxide reductase